jgi:3-oxoacyl-[acyl-carrier protein] reductase
MPPSVTLGPVEILVHNASGWLPDSFAGEEHGPFDRRLRPVSAATFDRQFAVDARGGAVLIAELAGRHVARGARRGRIVTLTSGGPMGFPRWGVLRLEKPLTPRCAHTTTCSPSLRPD